MDRPFNIDGPHDVVQQGQLELLGMISLLSQYSPHLRHQSSVYQESKFWCIVLPANHLYALHMHSLIRNCSKISKRWQWT